MTEKTIPLPSLDEDQIRNIDLMLDSLSPPPMAFNSIPRADSDSFTDNNFLPDHCFSPHQAEDLVNLGSRFFLVF
jgi:hypothetical protein